VLRKREKTICLICRYPIEQRHPSPPDIYLCGPTCFSKWVKIVFTIMEIHNMLYPHPMLVPQHLQKIYEDLEGTVNWILQHEKFSLLNKMEIKP